MRDTDVLELTDTEETFVVWSSGIQANLEEGDAFRAVASGAKGTFVIFHDGSVLSTVVATGDRACVVVDPLGRVRRYKSVLAVGDNVVAISDGQIVTL